jgi:hypothetical protein
VNITTDPGHVTRWAGMRRSTRLVVLVTLALVAMLAVASSAKADDWTCGRWSVTFNRIERGHAAGCFFANYDEDIPAAFVSGSFDVCDWMDEPGETVVARAQMMAAFTDGSGNWAYNSSPWHPAPGDGAGCFSYNMRWLYGPVSVAWYPVYVRITVEAPGKAVQQVWDYF